MQIRLKVALCLPDLGTILNTRGLVHSLCRMFVMVM
jgi:hypothetical protein